MEILWRAFFSIVYGALFNFLLTYLALNTTVHDGRLSRILFWNVLLIVGFGGVQDVNKTNGTPVLRERVKLG